MFSKFIRRIIRDPIGAFCLFYILLCIFVLFFADLIIPKDPYSIEITRQIDGKTVNAPYAPSLNNLFGTDYLGRDLLSRCLKGLQYSLIIGFVVRGITMIVGVLIGILAGYMGGRVDGLLMRLSDIMMTLPALLLAFVTIIVFGRSFPTLVLALVLVSWADVAKVIRAETLKLKNKQYVDASISSGANSLWIITKHILPNSIPIIIVSFTIGIPGAIMYEAALSFFGLGIPPPIPSLGSIISEARGYMMTAPWLLLFPGFILILLVLSINIIGDKLSEALDPFLKNR
jgi:ABC-type dipeptide/oligopeptide/nickel transport system permease subunit